MCKKLVCVLIVLIAVVGLVVPASADYWIGDKRMDDNGDGTYTATLTGLDAGSRQEFKIVNRVWDDEIEQYVDTWIPGSSEYRSNGWLYADAEGSVTIGLNTNTVSDGWLTATNRISLSTDGNGGGWTIAGSFGWSDNEAMPGGAGLPEWNPSGEGMAMTHIGDGIYELSLYLPSGGAPSWTGDPTFNTYAWKAVVTDCWDSISVDGRSVNTVNALLTVSPGNEHWTFRVDSLTGVVQVIPEPATIALLSLGLALIRRKR